MAPTRTPRKTVLVVEDNELNSKLFCDLLDAFGYDSVHSSDGLDAVDLARAHAPALIIMDIQLPKVSGLDVTRWLKDDEDLAQIPILAVTAFAMRADEKKVREAGCDGYLAKPIQMTPFRNTVTQLAEGGAKAA